MRFITAFLFMALSVLAQNTTNLYIGQKLYIGQQISNVASTGGGGGEQPMVTDQTIGSPRNDYNGVVGFGFTASSAITVTSLGRWVLSGNSQTHTLTLYDVTAAATVVTASINTSGLSADTYHYIAVSPVTLTVGHVYNLVSAEAAGGDNFGNTASITISSGVASDYGNVYEFGPYPAGGHTAYVPVNLLYH